MYIMWYFVFGALALLIPFLVMLIVCRKKVSYYDKEENKISQEIDNCMYDNDFSISRYEQNLEKEKELRKIRSTLRDKQHKWDKISFASGVPCVILIFVIIIFTVVSICVPLKSRFEVEDFKATYEMYERVSEGQSDIENIALSETANEYNKWLRHARVSKQRFGVFSKYYNQDIESLKYIGEKYE